MAEPVTIYGSRSLDGDLDAKGYDILDVNDIAVDTISSAGGASVHVILGSDAGDDFIVNTNKFVVEGDTGRIGIGILAPGVDLDLLGVHVSGVGIARFKGSATAGFMTLDTTTEENGESGFLLATGGVLTGQIGVVETQGAVYIRNRLFSSTVNSIVCDNVGNVDLRGHVNIGRGDADIDYSLTFDGENSNGIITWKEDEDYFEFADAVIFAGEGSGLAFGGISVKDNGVATAFGGTGIANKTQVLIFGVDDPSNNTTPAHGTDDITITVAGKYFACVTISATTASGGSDEYGFSLWKNNGDTEFTNVHAHRVFGGGAGDAGAIALSGIVDLAVNDTIEVWAWNEDDTESIVIDDITFSIVMLGGT